jgi:hypothetical protein
MEYGIGVLQAALECRLARMGLYHPPFLSQTGRRLDDPRQALDATHIGALRRRREDRTIGIGDTRDLDQQPSDRNLVAPVALH